MKNINYFTIRTLSALIVTCMLAAAPASAASLRLASIFNDGMVLQREMEVPVWGWSDPGAKISVQFEDQVRTAVTGDDGRWQVILTAMPASEKPAILIVSSGTLKREVKNVLVGEVWLCSGQSNMRWTMSEFGPAISHFIPEATNSLIRRFEVYSNPAFFPASDLNGRWQECSPKTVGGFSATAYFFGKELFEHLSVPIGLVTSSVGGTKIETWTNPAGFLNSDELTNVVRRLEKWSPATESGRKVQLKYLEDMQNWLPKARQALEAGTIPHDSPLPPGSTANRITHIDTCLYNGMIAPLVPYALRGAIWYQGEANYREGLHYYFLKKALINGWRAAWEREDLPFYFVQLPGFMTSSRNRADGGDGWAPIREAQTRTLNLPFTGMACTIDIGLAQNIHPPNKFDVGRRLALQVLAGIYGHNIIYSGPVYRAMQVEGDKVKLFFDHVHSGLMAGMKQGLAAPAEVERDALKWFAIAGADREWHWADAVVEDETVLLSCAAVKEPVAVRYAYTTNPVGPLLYNRAGLPALPFRTDDW